MNIILAGFIGLFMLLMLMMFVCELYNFFFGGGGEIEPY